MLIRGPSDDRWRPARLEWPGDEVHLRLDQQTWTAPIPVFPNGERDVAAALWAVAGAAAADGVRLRGCVSCVRFRTSGMLQQTSGGESGYCAFVGFRNPNGIVRVDHGCGEHAEAAGWPGDPASAHDARLALAAREAHPSREHAFSGALVGLAVGDALGYPVEFQRRDGILRLFGPQGVTGFVAGPSHHPPGTYSDDTQMTLAVATALLRSGDSDLDTLMQTMAEEFVSWSGSPDNDRAPGATCMEGARRLAAGMPWREAGVRSSKGCGSAMRVAPIGLFYWRDTPRLLQVARASSLLTHAHPAAIEGAAAAALLVALALGKRTPEEMLAALLAECAPRSEDLAARLHQLPEMVGAAPEVALSRAGLGEGWTAEEAVASALYCFWRSPEDFATTVLTGANTDGDSDSIACIAGAISGAFNGATVIPPPWFAQLEGGARIAEIARRLHEAAPP